MNNNNNNCSSALSLTPMGNKSCAVSVKSNVLTTYSHQRSEVYCNVRHVLNFIDQIESEHYRHAKAIEVQIQDIKDQLNSHIYSNNVHNANRVIGNSSKELLQIGRSQNSMSNPMEEDIGKNGSASFRMQLDASNQYSYSSHQLSSWSVQEKFSPIEQARHEPDQFISSPVDEQMFKVPKFIPSLNRSARQIKNKRITKNKPQNSDKFDSINKSIRFWQIELNPHCEYYQRFANIIYGLPKYDVLESLSEEQCKKEILEAIGWIEKSRFVPRERDEYQ